MNENKGWYWAYPYPKRHYFVDNVSLCKKVKIPGSDKLFAESMDTSNNCPECLKALGIKMPVQVVETKSAGIPKKAFHKKPVEIPKKAFHKKKP
jgi:hypothetical protein